MVDPGRRRLSPEQGKRFTEVHAGLRARLEMDPLLDRFGAHGVLIEGERGRAFAALRRPTRAWAAITRVLDAIVHHDSLRERWESVSHAWKVSLLRDAKAKPRYRVVRLWHAERLPIIAQ